MEFNWIDLIILAILLFFLVDAYGRTFAEEFIDLISFLTSFFLSFIFYSYPAKFLASQLNFSHGLSLASGFIIIWSLTELIFYVFAPVTFKILLRIQKRFSVINSLAVLPAFLKGLIFIALVLVVTLTLPIRPEIKRSIKTSYLGSTIVKNAYRLEAPVRGVFGGLGQDSLTFLTIKPKTNESVNLGFKTTDFKPAEDVENQMIDLVNNERLSRGIKALVFDKDLRALGRGHSADMLTRGYFSHYTPGGEDIAHRADGAKVYYTTIGENLAYAPALELGHTGLMNSLGHRANILSTDFTRIGVGIMDAGVYGLMFTQVFSN